MKFSTIQLNVLAFFLISVVFSRYLHQNIALDSKLFFKSYSLEVGDTAPDFKLKDSSGNDYQLSDFKGNIVVLDFWAMWCGPCKKKMPNIQELKDKYKDKNVEVLSILSMNEGAEKRAQSYFKEQGYSISLLYGNDELVANYQLQFLPTVTVIDKEGQILYHSTKSNPNEYEDIVNILNANIE